MPEIRHIAFYIITSRKGDDMKQGVFWLIDNKLLAIPFDKSKYPDGIAKSGDTYNHEKLWKYVKPQIATSRIITTLVVGSSKELKAKRLFI